MALDTGNYISDLSRLNPTATDPVSEGDDVLRFVKKILQKTFPMGTDSTANTGVGPDQAVQVIIAKSTAPTIGGTAAESTGLVWLDTTTNLLKIRNQANDAWITLAIDPETSNSVDVNAGTIDGAIIGGSVAAAVTTTSLVATTADINAGTVDATIIGATTPAAITTTDLTATTADINAGTVDAVLGGTTPAAVTGTTLKANTSLELATGATVTGIDNATLATGSATLLATQGAVKTYVDSQVTAQDLDVISDSGTIDIDLDSESLTVAGGSGLATSATGSTLTVAGEDATTSAKGVASFSSDHFSVSSGAVSIATDSIDDTLIDFGTGTNQVSTADVPEETNLYYTNVRADARIAAASVGDLDNVDLTGVADDDILKYDSASSSFKVEADRIANHLTTKGDLLGFSTEETRIPVGADGKVMTARASATFGIDWEDLVDNSAAMALALGG